MPIDYEGVMGVPITFIDICGSWLNYFYVVEDTAYHGLKIDGKKKYCRILLKWKDEIIKSPEEMFNTEREYFEYYGYDYDEYLNSGQIIK